MEMKVVIKKKNNIRFDLLIKNRTSCCVGWLLRGGDQRSLLY